MSLEQRRYIKRLLDELDSADGYFKKSYLENKKLKDTWNKLKEYLKSFDIKFLNEYKEHNLANTLENILNKMQELEQGSDNNE